ncbi:putative trbJ [Escherichia coli 4-203-08_S1_C3]|nr:putative trbJ [Escherichia coli 4-203-08_S1_C3]
MRNKQVVLLIAGISGIATGIIVSLNIPFIRQGLFYPASPVEIVVSLCLTFSVSVVFFVGAIVGWILVSEIYYSRMNGLNESSEISEETYDERKKKRIRNSKTEKLNGIMIMNAGFLIYILICFLVLCCRIVFMDGYACIFQCRY